MKIAFASVLVLIMAWILILVIRALGVRAKRQSAAPPKQLDPLQGYLGRLSAAISCQTVSISDPTDGKMHEHRKFRALLKSLYPKLNSTLETDLEEDFALLYRWQGSDDTLPPVILLAHTDVVPAPEDSLAQWQHPPFSGYDDGTFIWGRGTLDDKNCVMGICEAIELLCEENYMPLRTVYVAFGGDEELNSVLGTAKIVAHLKARGVKALCVHDEGSCVADGILQIVDKPLALIGIAEKGNLTAEFISEGVSGHAATPPRRTSGGRLASALSALEDTRFPGRLTESIRRLFSELAPYTGFGLSIILANLWCFSPLLKFFLSLSPATDALIRSTQAITMIEGSHTVNVLPKVSRAYVNVRIIPGESSEKIMRRYSRLAAKYGVKVKPWAQAPSNEPLPTSPVDHPGYRAIARAARETFSEVVPVPYTISAATDSRHYREITDAIYRIAPLRMNTEQLKSVHGTNERISHIGYAECIGFYYRFIKGLCS